MHYFKFSFHHFSTRCRKRTRAKSLVFFSIRVDKFQFYTQAVTAHTILVLLWSAPAPRLFFRTRTMSMKFFFKFFGVSCHLNSTFRCANNYVGAVIFQDTVWCADNNHNSSCCPHIVVVRLQPKSRMSMAQHFGFMFC